jgi:hypothetical protein
MAVTVSRLLSERRRLAPIIQGQCKYPGHVEHAIPVHASRPSSMDTPGPSLAEHARSSSSAGEEESSSSMPPLPRSERPVDDDCKFANLPDDLLQRLALAGTRYPPPRPLSVPPRTSHDTTFSVDPENYIVSDGFRPRSRPPSFTSSRGSSQGPPEYRSRPPSLHAVLLVAP